MRRRKELTTHRGEEKASESEGEEVISKDFPLFHKHFFTIKSDGLRKQNIWTSNCKRKSILFFSYLKLHVDVDGEKESEPTSRRLYSDCIWMRVRVIECDDDDERDEYESRHRKRRNNEINSQNECICDSFHRRHLSSQCFYPQLSLWWWWRWFFTPCCNISHFHRQKTQLRFALDKLKCHFIWIESLNFHFFFHFFSQFLQNGDFGEFRWKFITQLLFLFYFFFSRDSIEFFMYRSDPFHNQSTNEINFRDIKLFSLYFCFFSSLIYEEE